MIDAYRDLLAEHDAEVAAAEDRFRTRLAALLAGDQAFDAPPQASGPSTGPDDPGKGMPAAATAAAGDDRPADEAVHGEAVNPSRADPPVLPASSTEPPRRGAKATGRSGSVTAPAGAPSTNGHAEVRAPAATFRCPDPGCPRAARPFASRQALGTHRTRIHGRQPAQRAVPGAASAP